MTDTLTSALYSIPADDRETWVQMGMAIKSELGDSGFDLWDIWSRQSLAYKERDAKVAWRSFKFVGPSGRTVTIGSLYHEARLNGWGGTFEGNPRVTTTVNTRRAEREAQELKRAEERTRKAAALARDMLLRATVDHHPYLERKGFPEMGGLVLDDHLLVPMHHFRDYNIQTLQTITPDGAKKFLPGGRASQAVYKLGRGQERWYCEGYATALSVQAALRHLYRESSSQVWVCFSAANLAKVTGRSGYVIADHDESGTGEKYAKKTGVPYWMPSEVGTDANDYFVKYGVEALAEELRGMLNG